MREYLKVKDEPSLVRDKQTKAILNVDRSALNKYKEERARLTTMHDAIEEVKSLRELVVSLSERLAAVERK
mgnify:FL=1